MSDRVDEVLVVVDLQTAFRRPGQWFVPEFDRAASAAERLASGFAGWAVWTRFVPDVVESGTWVDYYDRWDEMRRPPQDRIWDLAPGLGEAAAGWGATLDLPTFSKWGPELADRVPPGDGIVLCGVATDCCVLATALGAVDAGRRVTLVPEACAGVDDGAHAAAVRLMALLDPMVRVMTVDEVLAERPI